MAARVVAAAPSVVPVVAAEVVTAVATKVVPAVAARVVDESFLSSGEVNLMKFEYDLSK